MSEPDPEPPEAVPFEAMDSALDCQASETLLHRSSCGTPSEADPEAPLHAHKPLTIGDVLEACGLGRHQLAVLGVVWAIWVLAGWVGTLVPYVLDAAGEAGGDWSRLVGPEGVLTVRDRSWTLLWAGVTGMIGNLLLGNLSDVRGRVFATTCAIGLCCVAVVGFGLARCKWLLLGFVVGTPFSRDGITAITMSLLAEWLPVRWRGTLVVTLHAIWNAGRLGLTLWWVICPPTQDWVTFFAVAAVVPLLVFLFLCAFGSRYESPRWLAVTGHWDRCLLNLRLATRGIAPGKLPPGWDSERLQLDGAGGTRAAPTRRSLRAQLAEMAAPGMVRVVGLLCVFNAALFFGSNGYFLWALEYFKRIGVDPRPAMVAAPLGKITCNLLLITPGPQRCPVDCWPRLPLMRAGFLGFAACLAALCFATDVVIITGLVFVSQVCEESLWTVGGLYMTEAFPTTVRNTALGVLFMMGHVGSIASASLAGEMLEIWTFLPLLSMAGGLLLGLGACLLLPPGHQDAALVDTLR